MGVCTLKTKKLKINLSYILTFNRQITNEIFFLPWYLNTDPFAVLGRVAWFTTFSCVLQLLKVVHNVTIQITKPVPEWFVYALGKC